MNTHDALARLAAFGLPGVPDDVVVPNSPDELLAAAESARILPWVAAALAAGRLAGVDDEWQARLRDRHLIAVHTTMAAHAAAAAVVDRLARGGIDDVIVLKGVATGHLDHERPIDRFSTDVDLLVRSGDIERLLSVFPQAAIPEPRRAGWEARYGKAITIVGETGVELDIHTSLAQGYFGLAIPPDALFDSTVEFSIAGTPLRALDAPNRLLHTAIHVAASARIGLHSARDIPQLVLASGVDWHEAVDRARAWKIDALVARGVLQAWGALALEPHPITAWAGDVHPTGRQRLALSNTGGVYARAYLTGPLALPVRRWPGYLYPIVWPSRAYLDEHGKTRTERIRLLLPGLLTKRSR